MPGKFRAVIVSDPNEKKPDGAIRLVCMSDTHGNHEMIKPESIPDCDLFLFAGDMSLIGCDKHVSSFKAWLSKLPFPKVVIAGNLDVTFDTAHIENFIVRIKKYIGEFDVNAVKPAFLENLDAIYLEHESTTVNNIKIFGSPYTPEFMDFAFQIKPGEGKERWADIPDDADIILCHGPPKGVCDETQNGMHVGSSELADAIKRIQPSLCVCGHIHESHGFGYIGDTLCCNVSMVDLSYAVIHQPTVIDLLPK